MWWSPFGSFTHLHTLYRCLQWRCKFQSNRDRLIWIRKECKQNSWPRMQIDKVSYGSSPDSKGPCNSAHSSRKSIHSHKWTKRKEQIAQEPAADLQYFHHPLAGCISHRRYNNWRINRQPLLLWGKQGSFLPLGTRLCILLLKIWNVKTD